MGSHLAGASMQAHGDMSGFLQAEHKVLEGNRTRSFLKCG